MAPKLSRRSFIRTSSALSAGVMASSFPVFAPSGKKPNLLFIWTDQQRADTMAVYGNKAIITPNLNRLAEQSFVFKKAYVTQPVCTPSRSSVMTGLYPHTSGVMRNNVPLPKEIPCFPELLSDPDYKTAYMGKWHLGDEVFAQHGFDTWVSIEDGYTEYYHEDKDRQARSSYHHWLRGKGYKPDQVDENKFSRGFAVSLPMEHCKPKFLEGEAIGFLEKNQYHPFVLYVNFLEPHTPYSGPLNDLHRPENVEIPANFDDPLDENEPGSYRKIREQQIESIGSERSDFRNLIRKYWGLVSQVDRSVGAILGKLEELGLSDNTIVVFTSDHGDMMGSHKMIGKSVMFEESVRIPFMMRIPQIARQQTIVRRNVSQIDIVPTLLGLMGKKVPAMLQGKSLVPLLSGNNIPEDYVFVEWNDVPNFYHGFKHPVHANEAKLHMQVTTRMVISPDGWKLSLSDYDHCQLFDLNKDPLETTNLYTDASYKDKVGFLTRKIREWQIEKGDGERIGIRNSVQSKQPEIGKK